MSLIGCSKGPSKSDALELVKRDVHREGVCTLPVDLISKTKKQHTSKAICLPRDPPAQLASCFAALVKADVAAPMPASFLREFTDETQFAPSPYDRRVREIDMPACFTMSPELREGRFICADVTVDKIAKITSTGETTADVRYLRTIKLHESLAAIEKACGATNHPAEDDTVAVVNNVATKQWTVAPTP